MAKSRSEKPYPRLPLAWNNRLERVRGLFTKHPVVLYVPPVIAFEAQLLLHAYHGSTLATVWHLLRYWFKVEFWGRYTNLAKIKICDWMGWTRVHHYPEKDGIAAHVERHGRYCEGYPYHEHHAGDCISDSVPRWFRWLVRF